MTGPTLYMVMLGGHHPAARIELHDIVFTAVDNTLERQYAKLKAQWFGDKKQVHIDGWMKISGLGHYRIELHRAPRPQPSSQQLYFYNLGGYSKQVFGEDHRYGVVIAENTMAAKQAALKYALDTWYLPHKDNLVDVDQCLPLDRIGKWHVWLVPGEHQGICFENCYIPL